MAFTEHTILEKLGWLFMRGYENHLKQKITALLTFVIFWCTVGIRISDIQKPENLKTGQKCPVFKWPGLA